MVEEIQQKVEKQYRTVTKTIDEAAAAGMFQAFIRTLKN
jgi:hypothetical protein